MSTREFIINILASILILIAVAVLPVNVWYTGYCVIAIIGLLIVEYVYNRSRELEDK